MTELKMLVLLMGSQQTRYSKEEMAERLGTTVRSVNRNIVRLKEAGFTFNEQRGMVSLNQSSDVYEELSRLVYFSEEDAAILYRAIDLIDSDTEAKRSLRKKLGALYASGSVRDKIIKLSQNEKVKKLLTAIDHRRRVILKNYSSPSSRTTCDRLVEPFALCDGEKQVWCWEPESQKNKIFNLSRLTDVEIQENECWRNGKDHQQGFVDAFRNISPTGKTMHVKLQLNQMAYNLMVEEYPLTEQDVKKIDQNTWLYEGEVSSYRGIGRFVIGLADCIEIQTKDLRSYIENFVNLYIK